MFNGNSKACSTSTGDKLAKAAYAMNKTLLMIANTRKVPMERTEKVARTAIAAKYPSPSTSEACIQF